ncbi:MAG: orotate phosphoribosyltransferase, partial [Nitrospira sp.]|nr:orotate phosphoribosyltransferase [Nitrospira sp.]
MLRKLFVVLGAVAMVSQAALVMAANPDTGPGCGLGKLAWADYKNQKNIA